MGRGPKPAKSKEAKPPVARKSPNSDGAKLRDLEKRLSEALAQQTATGEILRVISTSPTDVQPVLDAIAESVARLCNSRDVTMFRIDGGILQLAVHRGPIGSLPPYGEERVSLDRGSVVGRSVIERRTINLADLSSETVEYPEASARARRFGYRAVLSVPLLKDDAAIGAIVVRRLEARPSTERQIALLQTFAAQAVIAIENVRLFNETKEALEQQTATSEILQVIASSPTDIQPVLDAVAENAARVCGADDALIFRVDGDVTRRVAHHGSIPVSADVERRLTRDSVWGRSVVDRRTVHVPDIEAEAGEAFADSTPLARQSGARTHLATPLMRRGAVIGAILIRRLEVRLFTAKQISLLQTFADQAVIAIENVRLFKELEARNTELTDALAQQTATAEILQVISNSPTNTQPVFDAIVNSAKRLLSGHGAMLSLVVGDMLHLAALTARDAAVRLDYPRSILSHDGPPSRAVRDCAPAFVIDIQTDPTMGPQTREQARQRGFRSALSVPMLREGEAIGAISVSRAEPGPFSNEEIALLRTFADQAVIAIENVRLFKELEMVNRELAAASKHKSDFLANMSHELRTPLNAIMGFSEALSERMFGELNEKQEEYLKDINASGAHLLSLINDILDLSKIEAGRMELELSDFHLPTALDNALMLVRERAGRRSITLHTSIDERLGEVRADERKIRQVVLNLLSNAIKFTPEGGQIEVRAVPVDGSVEVSVSDTGVGIAPEDHEKVFEEFRQVGTADKKAEGTGLGLTLCRKFIQLHGGRIWVKSQVGQGSTFTFTIPARRGE
jgi:two-component system, NtrC family, sensor kinase